MADKWTYTITEQDVERVQNINKDITDLVKAYNDGEIGDTESGGTSTKPSTVTPPSTPPSSAAGTTTTAGGSTPSTPPAGGGGSGGSTGGGMTPGGGHSTVSNRVRGIQSQFTGKIKFVDPTTWVRSGNGKPSWEQISSSPKWNEFKDVKNEMKKQWSKLLMEEVEEVTLGHIIADEIDMDDYIANKEKHWNKIEVPSNDQAQLNIIIALDASGSTGRDRQYNMSGVSFAMKRTLEELGIKHSFMIYDDSVSLLDVDCKNRSGNGNVLMADMCGMGGNDEDKVLDIARAIANKNTDDRNVVLIISDGGVADVKKTLAAMKKEHKRPLNVYCLGYDDSFDEEYAKEIFGTDRAFGSKDKKTFARNVINILRNEITQEQKGNE